MSGFWKIRIPKRRATTRLASSTRYRAAVEALKEELEVSPLVIGIRALGEAIVVWTLELSVL